MMARTKTLTWMNRCQKCGKERESTRYRTLRTKNYMGPCGDSFCYASCDMDSCHPVSMTVCDGCAEKITGKKEPAPPVSSWSPSVKKPTPKKTPKGC